MAITDPGDEIILQTPYYFNQEMAVTMLNCRPVLVPTDERFQLQLERIRSAITSVLEGVRRCERGCPLTSGEGVAVIATPETSGSRPW